MKYQIYLRIYKKRPAAASQIIVNLKSKNYEKPSAPSSRREYIDTKNE